MSFRVRIPEPTRRKIAAWDLPDFLIVEIYTRLRERLADHPARQLVRMREPFDGMVYGFSIVDPGNRLLEHTCFLHIMYSQDEQSLEAVNFGYLRRIGV